MANTDCCDDDGPKDHILAHRKSLSKMLGLSHDLLHFAQMLVDDMAKNCVKGTILAMKGETLLLNGDHWTIVDVAPAAELAEMVAAILEEEGFPVIVRGVDGDVFSHMGTSSLGTTYVLVPEKDTERALVLISETVTDYEGDELDKVLEQMAAESDPEDIH